MIDDQISFESEGPLGQLSQILRSLCNNPDMLGEVAKDPVFAELMYDRRNILTYLLNAPGLEECADMMTAVYAVRGAYGVRETVVDIATVYISATGITPEVNQRVMDIIRENYPPEAEAPRLAGAVINAVLNRDADGLRVLTPIDDGSTEQLVEISYVMIELLRSVHETVKGGASDGDTN